MTALVTVFFFVVVFFVGFVIVHKNQEMENLKSEKGKSFC